jgi:hypothetical protein
MVSAAPEEMYQEFIVRYIAYINNDGFTPALACQALQQLFEIHDKCHPEDNLIIDLKTRIGDGLKKANPSIDECAAAIRVFKIAIINADQGLESIFTSTFMAIFGRPKEAAKLAVPKASTAACSEICSEPHPTVLFSKLMLASPIKPSGDTPPTKDSRNMNTGRMPSMIRPSTFG